MRRFGPSLTCVVSVVVSLVLAVSASVGAATNFDQQPGDYATGGERVVMAVLAVLFLACAWRFARIAVVLSRDGITVRNFWRTHFVDWNELVEAQGDTGWPFWCMDLVTTHRRVHVSAYLVTFYRGLLLRRLAVPRVQTIVAEIMTFARERDREAAAK